jgi:hypothetical protein
MNMNRREILLGSAAASTLTLRTTAASQPGQPGPNGMTMQRHFVVLEDGTQLHYRRAGSGPPVVLLHSSPQSGAASEPMALRLAAHFTAICRDTPGIMAVNIGDSTNNWVGRLMRLYADQEVTSKQALKLIEWLMTALPWLLDKEGNHDLWNTEKGDPAEVIHRLMKLPGIREMGSSRLRLALPSGAEVLMHVRHDFPGGSQFNPAHALVRETLFGFRDHILMCGHRHSSGYIPVFHNDPRRLCHGFRLGTYKDFDHYAAEKGFQDTNWARSMGAVINPDHADDPTRYIKPFFNLEEMAEYLTWRRGKWEVGKSAA